MDRGNYRALAAVRAALTRHGSSLFTLADGPNLRGPTIRVDYGKTHSVLTPVWAGEGYPTDVERALQDAGRRDLHPRETLVVVARRMSRGARERLSVMGVSWADEEGRAFIRAEPGLLVVHDRAAVRTRPTSDEVRWSEGSGAVAEYLLGRVSGQRLSPDEPAMLPPVTVVAERIGVSPPLASRTLQGFDAQGWTTKVGPERGSQSGRLLSDPGGLLSAWAAWHSSGRAATVQAHAFIRTADGFIASQIEPNWGDHWWALTGLLALDHRAPITTSIPVIDLYLDRQAFADPRVLNDLLVRAGLRTVETGARVHIIEADPYLPRLTEESWPTREVGDVRLYADLLRSGVRGQEAADHLRETRIGF